MKGSLPRYRWVALGLALLAQGSSAFILQAPSPLAPLFLAELGLTKAEVGLLSSATSTGAWSIVLVGGLLADRFGIRKVISIGLMVAGSLLLSMSVVSSLHQAIAVMFVAGLARGTIFPSSTKAVLEWFPPTARATAMGIKQLGLPLSGILAASTLPTLGLALGWRTAMALPGLLIVTIGVAVALLYRQPPGQAKLTASRVNIREALAGLIGNRSLLSLCLVAFFFLICQLALLTYLALYFKEVVLLSAIPDEGSRIVAAGGFLAVCQVGGAMGRVAWGVVSDRLFHGRRMIVLVIIGALSALLSLLVAFLSSEFPLWLLAAIVFAYGTVSVGWNGVYNAVLAEKVDRKYAATGLGLSMTLTEVGTIAGPPLFGLAIDISNSYQVAWILLALVSALGTVAALPASRGERRAAIA